MTGWLVADIGGTNARFAIARLSPHGGLNNDHVNSERVNIECVEKFSAADFENIYDAAEAYLANTKLKPGAACFAVAAPIDGSEVSFTNSPWTLKTEIVKKKLGIEQFFLVNDFYALAKGVSKIGADRFTIVKPGAGDPRAPKIVIGPGTGLGQALILPAKMASEIISTEGGHVAFGPRSEEEISIMKFIARDHTRVSVERLLSGDGLVNIYGALCAAAGKEKILSRAEEVSAAALSREEPLAVRAVDVFCAILGDVVGDAVLATGARGGVILGGGIVPVIKDIFLESEFLDRFSDKGRMRSYFDGIPVRLIADGNPALVGAATVIGENTNNDL